MDRALFAAASGMSAQQRNLETISDNLANSEVAGFKQAAQTFAVLAAPGDDALGTISVGSHLVLTQGKLEPSNGPFDVALEGPGFFVVRQGKRTAYTRDGEFSRTADGALRNAEGWRLEGVRLPPDAVKAEVAADGAVAARFADNHTQACGRVAVAAFAAPEHLQRAGSLFFATPASGSPQHIAPRNDGATRVRFGMLEKSNVSIVESMMQILAAQRAYEANAKGVQAADEMLRIANNLQRG